MPWSVASVVYNRQCLFGTDSSVRAISRTLDGTGLVSQLLCFLCSRSPRWSQPGKFGSGGACFTALMFLFVPESYVGAISGTLDGTGLASQLACFIPSRNLHWSQLANAGWDGACFAALMLLFGPEYSVGATSGTLYGAVLDSQPSWFLFGP